MKAELIRFRRKRLAVLAAACALIGVPLVLVSQRGATAFEVGATFIGTGVGLLVLAALLTPLAKLKR